MWKIMKRKGRRELNFFYNISVKYVENHAPQRQTEYKEVDIPLCAAQAQFNISVIYG